MSVTAASAERVAGTRSYRASLLPLLSVAGFLAVWYIAAEIANSRLLPGPVEVLHYVWNEALYGDMLAELGITLGCDANNYCPSQVVTRGQMAAFLIRAFDAGFNGPPAVSAGADQAITLPSAARLTGFVSDDGRPTCALTLLWSQVSGPGAVTFSDPDSEATMASFSQPGTYVLRLMASDFQTASTDDLTITVNPIDPSNQPPSASAGRPFADCRGSTHDLLPFGA